MNKSVYLKFPLLNISKTKIYDFWYDYIKPKYSEKADLLYGYRQLHYSCKTEDFYKDIAKDIEKKFNSSNYDVDRPLLMGKNKKVIGLMKDKSGRKIMNNCRITAENV